MRPHWTRFLLALVPALLLGTGCSGINASHSVSPLDFLIPGGGGLMRSFLYVPPYTVPGVVQVDALIAPVASVPIVSPPVASAN
ncbi:MAG: hypothetical protein HY301_09955 [Verrucomicrobia bacterium]|nr:hypothetical protein [Verrucomicrobiota bacterium]